MVNKCPGAEPENSEKGWPSLVRRRSLLSRCPLEVYLSVRSQLTVESRIDRAENSMRGVIVLSKTSA